MIKVSEREIAAFALIDIVEDGGYNNIVLKRTLNQYRGIEPASKNMITEIVNGTLRNLILIDYVIDKFSKTPVTKLKPLIRSILRISVYQILFMDKVPESAVCNEAVKIAKAKGLTGLSGYVNGVLRSIVRNKNNLEFPDYDKNPRQFISVTYSHPLWLIDYWSTFMGMDQIMAICRINNSAPSISICVNTLKTTKENLIKRLESEGMEVAASAVSNSALKIRKTADLRNSPAFVEGLFHVMDESSMMAVEAAKAKKGMTVIDLCSAPGGKSFYCAYNMENLGIIKAYDVHEHKLELFSQSTKRLGITNIEMKIGDATKLNHSLVNTADVVLLDAPCSGLGLLRKKPDAKFRKSMDDIKTLANIQKQMLSAAAQYSKIGGVLLYSTCTISKMENQDNVAWFLENFPYTLEYEASYLPSTHDTDGFFIARFVRKGKKD